MRNCLKDVKIPQDNFFFEPEARNTFGPIALLSYLIYLKDREALVAVLPSDHYIPEREEFLKVLAKGFKVAGEGFLVTLGVPICQPETGYGYIKRGLRLPAAGCYKVKMFTEKPDLAMAKKFFRSGNYYWNAGIFIFKAKTILDEIKRLLPDSFKVITQMQDKKSIASLWRQLPATSLDYAILEKTHKGACLKADCGWTDLGSWLAVAESIKKDRFGNSFKGRCINLDSRNTFIHSCGQLVAAIGLKDIILVSTKDAILACDRSKAQEVKRIVELLKLRNLKKYL
jgi:mannose-1-phosphate guanylyltransferase/mannose-6-phosphate isomerase